jgi:hypothetical protein
MNELCFRVHIKHILICRYIHAYVAMLVGLGMPYALPTFKGLGVPHLGTSFFLGGGVKGVCFFQ